jgi:tetratricopeptide (TPR) repeat protein
LLARAGYHMVASEYPQAIRLAREVLPLTEALAIHELRIRALDVLGCARAMSGDIGGLDDSRRAIALGRDGTAFFHLIRAEHNLYCAQVFLGQLDAASDTLSMLVRDTESYGTDVDRRFLRGFQAYEAVLHGRWDEAARILDELIAEAEARATYFFEPAWRALRATIELARGDLEAASSGSEQALERARKTKDPQILAPALTLRGIVLVAQGLRREASGVASEVLALGASLVGGFQAEMPAPTLIDFAWLLRDLGREAELLSALDSAPGTPWVEAAKAIAHECFPRAVEQVARIGAPSVEAYTRLRAAEELAHAGRHAEAEEQLGRAPVFFRKVGATRYIAQAEELLAASA